LWNCGISGRRLRAKRLFHDHWQSKWFLQAPPPAAVRAALLIPHSSPPSEQALAKKISALGTAFTPLVSGVKFGESLSHFGSVGFVIIMLSFQLGLHRPAKFLNVRVANFAALGVVGGNGCLDSGFLCGDYRL
jgi:hypothetical protein